LGENLTDEEIQEMIDDADKDGTFIYLKPNMNTIIIIYFFKKKKKKKVILMSFYNYYYYF